MTKKQFIEDVKKEIRAIKKHSKPEERAKLTYSKFNPDRLTNCIYGQMTGHCRNERAVELIRKCCQRILNLDKVNGTVSKTLRTNPDSIINGKNAKVIKQGSWNVRQYQSALEGHILVLGKRKSAPILSYLKGETNKLEL
jgi:hypothetical protein